MQYAAGKPASPMAFLKRGHQENRVSGAGLGKGFEKDNRPFFYFWNFIPTPLHKHAWGWAVVQSSDHLSFLLLFRDRYTHSCLWPWSPQQCQWKQWWDKGGSTWDRSRSRRRRGSVKGLSNGPGLASTGLHWPTGVSNALWAPGPQAWQCWPLILEEEEEEEEEKEGSQPMPEEVKGEVVLLWHLQKPGSWHYLYLWLFSPSHITYFISDVQVGTSLWGRKVPSTWGSCSEMRLF